MNPTPVTLTLARNMLKGPPGRAVSLSLEFIVKHGRKSHLLGESPLCMSHPRF